jgi:hypothetical protein
MKLPKIFYLDYSCGMASAQTKDYRSVSTPASVWVSPDSIGVMGVFNLLCKYNQLVPGISRRVT